MDLNKESYICIKKWKHSLTVGKEYFVTDYNHITKQPYVTGDDGRQIYVTEDHFK